MHTKESNRGGFSAHNSMIPPTLSDWIHKPCRAIVSSAGQKGRDAQEISMRKTGLEVKTNTLNIMLLLEMEDTSL